MMYGNSVTSTESETFYTEIARGGRSAEMVRFQPGPYTVLLPLWGPKKNVGTGLDSIILYFPSLYCIDHFISDEKISLVSARGTG